MRIVKKGEIFYFTSALLDRCPAVGHAISTRLGGVSEGPYRSLNLARSLGDSDANVFRNRERFCAAVGANYDRLTSARQMMGAEVIAHDGTAVGNLSQGSPAARPSADGHVTDLADTPLLTLSADCVPILLADPSRGAVGNVHASRKGTLGGIAARAVQSMRERYGCDPAELLACIAPSIGPCCYEVGAEAADEARARLTYAADFLIDRDGRTFLDLWGLNRRQLELAGLKPDRIDAARMCSRCVSEFFFSYRREGERSGRYGAAIWRKAGP